MIPIPDLSFQSAQQLQTSSAAGIDSTFRLATAPVTVNQGDSLIDRLVLAVAVGIASAVAVRVLVK